MANQFVLTAEGRTMDSGLMTALLNPKAHALIAVGRWMRMTNAQTGTNRRVSNEHQEIPILAPEFFQKNKLKTGKERA